MVIDVGGALKASDAKKLIREIVASGTIFFSDHARTEMAKDDIDENDVTNVLRGGKVLEGEWENGSWRYRVETPKFCVVVAFRTETMLVVVTAWRKR